jgi:YhcH/YjgK/YiaL family protein
MIFDVLGNAYRYKGLGNRLEKAFENLSNTDYSGFEPGKYEIDGDSIFALVSEYETRSKEGSQFEAHRKYVDLQYMISGEELVGYAPLQTQVPSREYDAENDYALFPGDASFVRFSAGMFAIFFPGDLHMPSVSDEPQQVKKVVIKVRV